MSDQKNSQLKNKKVIQAWLRKAEDDFNFAKDTLKEEKFYDHVCALSQQAVEKYIKALLIKLQGELRKDQKHHRLVALSQLVKEKKGPDLLQFSKELSKLTEAYIPARYPDAAFGQFSEQEAAECLEAAERIIDYIKQTGELAIYYDEQE